MPKANNLYTPTPAMDGGSAGNAGAVFRPTTVPPPAAEVPRVTLVTTEGVTTVIQPEPAVPAPEENE